MVQSKSKSIFFYSIFLLSFVFFLRILWPFVTAFVLALILGVVCYPLHSRLVQTLQGRRGLASVLTCGAVVFVVIIPVGIFLGLLVRETVSLADWAQNNVRLETVAEFIEDNEWITRQMEGINHAFNAELTPSSLTKQLVRIGEKAGGYLYTQGRVIGANFFQAILNFIFMLFILFYFFRDGKKFAGMLIEVSPFTENQERHLLRTFQTVSRAVIFGNVLSVVLQGIVAGFSFWIFGLQGAVFWGFAIGIFSLIPAVGGMIIYLPAAVVLSLGNGVPVGLIFFILNFLFGNIIDNVLKPKVIETKIKAHPLLVFFSILGGVAVFGVFGILYGPLVTIIFLTLFEMYRTDFKQSLDRVF